MKTIEKTSSLSAVGPYSLAIEANGFIILSGQIGIDKDLNLITGGVAKEFEKIMSNTKDILAEYKLDFDNIIQIRNFLTNLEDFPIINDLYRKYFEEPFPVRTTFQVAGIPLNASIEVEFLASVVKRR